MRGAMLDTATAFLLGMLTYLSLSKIVVLAPDITIPLLIGVIVGWHLRGNMVYAASIGAMSSLSALMLFGIPSFSMGLAEPVLENDVLVQAVLTSPWTPVAIGLATLSAMATAAFIGRGRDLAIGIAVVMLLAVNLVVTVQTLNAPAYTDTYQRVANEPENEAYGFDAFIHIKTFYLMEEGTGYYGAMSSAVENDTRFAGPPSQVPSYRLPALYYLWKVLLPPSGVSVNSLFVTFSIFAMALAFLLVLKFSEPRVAVLSPLLLSPYLAYGAASLWFPFAEYWAAFVGLGAITAAAYSDRVKWLLYGAIVLAFLAAVIREQLIVLPVAGVAASLAARNWRRAAAWMLPVAGFVAVYAAHYAIVKKLLGSAGVVVEAWASGISFQYVLDTVMFGSVLYPTTAWLPVGVAVAAVAGSLLVDGAQERVFLAGVVVLPAVAYIFIHSGPYWGATYMPFAWTLAPLLIRRNITWWQGSYASD